MSVSALNEPAELPRELDRWNWGAFFLNWIWGIGNSSPIALLALVPFFGLIMLPILGFRGSRWAWRNRAWRDVEHFRSVQRKWAIWGLVSWIVVIGGTVGLFSSIMPMFRSSEVHVEAMRLVQADARVRAALGDDVEAGFWVTGAINVDAAGGGRAELSIPLSGSKGEGRAYVRGIRRAGTWELPLVVVRVQGSEVPIVLRNSEAVQVPNAPIDL